MSKHWLGRRDLREGYGFHLVVGGYGEGDLSNYFEIPLRFRNSLMFPVQQWLTEWFGGLYSTVH